MKISKKYVWDYDVKTLDLSNRVVLLWYLSRLVNCGQWKEIDSKLLEKHLDELDIDLTLMGMLKEYYAYKKSKNHS